LSLLKRGGPPHMIRCVVCFRSSRRIRAISLPWRRLGPSFFSLCLLCYLSRGTLHLRTPTAYRCGSNYRKLMIFKLGFSSHASMRSKSLGGQLKSCQQSECECTQDIDRVTGRPEQSPSTNRRTKSDILNKVEFLTLTMFSLPTPSPKEETCSS
jgi:hypothetical protein